MTGASAATLLGLLFVALSISAPTAKVKLHRNTRHLADQAFQNYLVVMLVSLFAIFPSLTQRELGFVTLGLTALRLVWAVIRLGRHAHRVRHRERHAVVVGRDSGLGVAPADRHGRQPRTGFGGRSRDNLSPADIFDLDLKREPT